MERGGREGGRERSTRLNIVFFSPAMEKKRMIKYQELLNVIDQSGGFYDVPVELQYRSHVNVPFRIYVAGQPSPELEAEFLKEATGKGYLQLKVIASSSLPTCCPNLKLASLSPFHLSYADKTS